MQQKKRRKKSSQGTNKHKNLNDMIMNSENDLSNKESLFPSVTIVIGRGNMLGERIQNR